MQFANNPERECILDQVLDARTLPEIAAVTELLREWLRLNPSDTGIREAFGGLSLMRDIAEEQKAERVHPAQKTVAAA